MFIYQEYSDIKKGRKLVRLPNGSRGYSTLNRVVNGTRVIVYLANSNNELLVSVNTGQFITEVVKVENIIEL